MSKLLRSLSKFVEVFKQNGIPYAVLGGLAIPAYGIPRSTVLVDIGVAVEAGKIGEIMRKLKARRLVSSEKLDPESEVVRISDLDNIVQAELWFRPDGIKWDEETLRKRWKLDFKAAGEHLEAHVLSPEDFVVNKLARRDRSARDEEDVVGVLKSSSDSIDWRYLDRRAKAAGVSDLVRELSAKMRSAAG